MSRNTKRKRSDESQGVSKKQKATKNRPKQAPELTPVRGDALKWDRVALPDRLDDAEGFYDLEEIDDVEVIRDERNHVMFRPKSASAVLQNKQVNEEDGSEWVGFRDGDDANKPSSQIASAKKTRKEADKPGILKKTQNAVSKPAEDDELADLSYDALSSLEKPAVDVSAWEEMGLSQEMMNAISHLGFSKPTAIQSSAVPPILEGKNVIGKAVTGSGKTLAFGIPIIERFIATQSTENNPIALILAPTRELAHQLDRHLSEMSAGLENAPRIVKVTGGLSILKQQRQLEHADIIVGTPGRMWEVINDSHGLIDRLKKIQFLVIDEADRLLSEGHFNEVEEILELLDREVIDDNGGGNKTEKSPRQTLVFSATFHKNLHQKLAGKLKSSSSNLLSNQQSLAYLLQKLSFRSKPVFIDSNPTSNMASLLNESIVECGAMAKDLFLYTTLFQNPRLKTLVFTNSISSVKRITPLLQSLSQSAVALHSSMPQKSRLRALERYTPSSGNERSILIATDVAARGLDIPDIDLIIHYHVPRTADMYVHRSGRTARAEKAGRSILLCSPDEVVPTSRLISKVHGEGKAPDVKQVDREIVKRVRPRIELAQKIVDAEQAKDKLKGKDEWLRTAAEELGVDYDSEDFEQEGRRHQRGRGGGKTAKLKEKGGVGKDQVRAWREELKGLLAKKVNLGVSERYLAGGRVDIDSILDGKGEGIFLEGR